jgi:hypothetical protein
MFTLYISQQVRCLLEVMAAQPAALALEGKDPRFGGEVDAPLHSGEHNSIL